VGLRAAAVDPRLVSSFWRGKRVLVTGHSGFKGSWLCLWLASLGAEPVGFSDGSPTDPALFDLSGMRTQMRSIAGDVRDPEAVLRVVEQERPEVVFHMAAQALVRRSLASPALTYEVNAMGTVNVLEAVRQTSDVRVFVNVTPSGYGRPPRGERRPNPVERDLLQPHELARESER